MAQYQDMTYLYRQDNGMVGNYREYTAASTAVTTLFTLSISLCRPRIITNTRRESQSNGAY